MSLSDQPTPVSLHSQSRRRAAMGLAASACLPVLPAWLQAADKPQALAPALPVRLELASEWSPGRSPVGFVVSEKLDGVRAVWDGTRLRFRSGRPLAAPDWLLSALPPEPLDGELWLGRGRFDSLSAIVRSNPADANNWQSVRYMVFDMPEQPGSFAQRYARLQALVAASGQPWLEAITQRHGSDAAALERQLRELTQAGAEGLVLHRWDAPWQPGRSQAVYKFKLQPDAEATVCAHLPGKGKYAGRTGALLVESDQGVRFALGSGLSDAQRADPPPVGAQVTYRYRGLTAAGVPRFATLLRVREAE
jgi:DNA ligase-1